MEELRKVVYGKVADKSVGAKMSSIWVAYGGKHMIRQLFECLQQSPHPPLHLPPPPPLT